MTSKFTPSTDRDRIEYLRSTIRKVIEAHGAPCGCILCESLIFDCLAEDGILNLKTGQRKETRRNKK